MTDAPCDWSVPVLNIWRGMGWQACVGVAVVWLVAKWIDGPAKAAAGRAKDGDGGGK